MLVALDSNLIDLLLESEWTVEHADAAEALDEPPPFVDDHLISRRPPSDRHELWARFWLRALASSWPSVLYTFSDLLYEEAAATSNRDQNWARWLVGFAIEIRENHPAEHRTLDQDEAPSIPAVLECGVKGEKDARHVSEAIGVGCDHLLTRDGPLRKAGGAIQVRWGLQVRKPSEFLVEMVRQRRAPWPHNVPWPWEPRNL